MPESAATGMQDICIQQANATEGFTGHPKQLQLLITMTVQTERTNVEERKEKLPNRGKETAMWQSPL